MRPKKKRALMVWNIQAARSEFSKKPRKLELAAYQELAGQEPSGQILQELGFCGLRSFEAMPKRIGAGFGLPILFVSHQIATGRDFGEMAGFVLVTNPCHWSNYVTEVSMRDFSVSCTSSCGLAAVAAALRTCFSHIRTCFARFLRPCYGLLNALSWLLETLGACLSAPCRFGEWV